MNLVNFIALIALLVAYKVDSYADAHGTSGAFGKESFVTAIDRANADSVNRADFRSSDPYEDDDIADIAASAQNANENDAASSASASESIAEYPEGGAASSASAAESKAEYPESGSASSASAAESTATYPESGAASSAAAAESTAEYPEGGAASSAAAAESSAEYPEGGAASSASAAEGSAEYPDAVAASSASAADYPAGGATSSALAAESTAEYPEGGDSSSAATAESTAEYPEEGAASSAATAESTAEYPETGAASSASAAESIAEYPEGGAASSSSAAESSANYPVGGAASSAAAAESTAEYPEVGAGSSASADESIAEYPEGGAVSAASAAESTAAYPESGAESSAAAAESTADYPEGIASSSASAAEGSVEYPEAVAASSANAAESTAEYPEGGASSSASAAESTAAFPESGAASSAAAAESTAEYPEGGDASSAAAAETSAEYLEGGASSSASAAEGSAEYPKNVDASSESAAESTAAYPESGAASSAAAAESSAEYPEGGASSSASVAEGSEEYPEAVAASSASAAESTAAYPESGEASSAAAAESTAEYPEAGAASAASAAESTAEYPEAGAASSASASESIAEYPEGGAASSASAAESTAEYPEAGAASTASAAAYPESGAASSAAAAESTAEYPEAGSISSASAAESTAAYPESGAASSAAAAESTAEYPEGGDASSAAAAETSAEYPEAVASSSANAAESTADYPEIGAASSVAAAESTAEYPEAGAASTASEAESTADYPEGGVASSESAAESIAQYPGDTYPSLKHPLLKLLSSSQSTDTSVEPYRKSTTTSSENLVDPFNSAESSTPYLENAYESGESYPEDEMELVENSTILKSTGIPNTTTSQTTQHDPSYESNSGNEITDNKSFAGTTETQNLSSENVTNPYFPIASDSFLELKSGSNPNRPHSSLPYPYSSALYNSVPSSYPRPFNNAVMPRTGKSYNLARAKFPKETYNSYALAEGKSNLYPHISNPIVDSQPYATSTISRSSPYSEIPKKPFSTVNPYGIISSKLHKVSYLTDPYSKLPKIPDGLQTTQPQYPYVSQEEKSYTSGNTTSSYPYGSSATGPYSSEVDAATGGTSESLTNTSVLINATSDATPNATSLMSGAPLNATSLASDASLDATALASDVPLDATALASGATLDATALAGDAPLDATVLASDASLDTTPLGTTSLKSGVAIDATSLTSGAPLNSTSMISNAPLNATSLASDAPLNATALASDDGLDATALASDALLDVTSLTSSAPLNAASLTRGALPNATSLTSGAPLNATFFLEPEANRTANLTGGELSIYQHTAIPTNTSHLSGEIPSKAYQTDATTFASPQSSAGTTAQAYASDATSSPTESSQLGSTNANINTTDSILSALPSSQQPEPAMITTVSALILIAATGEMYPWRSVRLPQFISPVHYNLLMHPNLTTFENFGTVNITLQVVNETNFLIFHSKENNLTKISLTDDNNNEITIAKTLVNLKHEQVYIGLEKTLMPKKNYFLNIEFNKYLKQNLNGFYIGTYHTSLGQKRRIATTHFEATEARSAFPCFDEPALKATFQLTMVHHQKNRAFFNTEAVGIKPYADNLLMTNFDQTLRMSTYLVAFVVCDFKEISKEANGTKIRVIVPPKQFDEAQYALDTAIQALPYYNAFFKIKYPLMKLDMIAVPDFGTGATENWGLITFRMTDILYSPSETSNANKERITRAVAHEIAHQWFGNLVTMNWWSDLWLNKGFACFMEYFCTSFLHPEWKMMDEFIISVTQESLSLDGLVSSHPVMVEVRNTAEIEAIFDSISYRKGAAILHMMHSFLGTEKLKQGIHFYLNKHKFRNARTADLWHDLTNVVYPETNLNITKIMDTWTRQKGFPLLTVTLEGTMVKVKQDRFVFTPTENKIIHVSPYGYKWYVPVTYLTDVSRENMYWLNRTDGEFPLPPGSTWLKLNANQTGFYRVMYDEHLWKQLVYVLLTNHETLHPADRANLLDDALTLSWVGVLDSNIALSLTRYLKNEEQYVGWAAATPHFDRLHVLLHESPALPIFQRYMRRLLKPIIRKLGWVDSGDHMKKKLRSAVLLASLNFNDQETITIAKMMFQNWMEHGVRIPPNLRNLVYSAGIKYGGEKEWKFGWKHLNETVVPSEKELMLIALGQTQDVWRLSQYLNNSLDRKKTRPQHVKYIIEIVARNPIGRLMTWRFLRMNWPKIIEIFGHSTTSIDQMISRTITHFSTKFDYGQVKKFFSEVELGSGFITVQNCMEKIRANIVWRKKSKDAVIRWLMANDQPEESI